MCLLVHCLLIFLVLLYFSSGNEYCVCIQLDKQEIMMAYNQFCLHWEILSLDYIVQNNGSKLQFMEIVLIKISPTNSPTFQIHMLRDSVRLSNCNTLCGSSPKTATTPTIFTRKNLNRCEIILETMIWGNQNIKIAIWWLIVLKSKKIINFC